MDKAIEQLLKIFNHLAREIQVYVLSGFLIAVNILIIDYFYYNLSLWNIIKTNSLEIPAIFILYILGQLSMALYYTIIELPSIDEKIKSILKLDYIIDSTALPSIYKKDPEIYMHFVERYVILTMMRWTLSAACFINFITDIIFLLKKDYHWQILLITLISFVGSIILLLLTTRTEKDYSDRIDSLKDKPVT